MAVHVALAQTKDGCFERVQFYQCLSLSERSFTDHKKLKFCCFFKMYWSMVAMVKLMPQFKCCPITANKGHSTWPLVLLQSWHMCKHLQKLYWPWCKEHDGIYRVYFCAYNTMQKSSTHTMKSYKASMQKNGIKCFCTKKILLWTQLYIY